jgi:hypothetical protein
MRVGNGYVSKPKSRYRQKKELRRAREEDETLRA